MQEKGCLRDPLVYPQRPASPGVSMGLICLHIPVYACLHQNKTPHQRAALGQSGSQNLSHASDTWLTPPNYQDCLCSPDRAVYGKGSGEGGQLPPCEMQPYQALVHCTPGPHDGPVCAKVVLNLKASLCLWLCEAVSSVGMLVPGTHEIGWGSQGQCHLWLAVIG